MLQSWQIWMWWLVTSGLLNFELRVMSCESWVTSFELWVTCFQTMIFCPIFHSWHDLLRKLNEGSWIDDIYASNSHKIKKTDVYVNRECWPFTLPRTWLFLSRPLNFGAACLISCSQRRVNQHILRWLLENVILHHQVKMEVRDGGGSSYSR